MFSEVKPNFALQRYLAHCPPAKESRHSGVGVSEGEGGYYASVGFEAQTSCFLPRGKWQNSQCDFVNLSWFMEFLPFVQGRLHFSKCYTFTHSSSAKPYLFTIL